jgi:glycosyltransferase involved in cell wall biosynthesis
MATISACILVKNEEKTIKRCLESIKDVVDEIIIIDDYGIDNTLAICGDIFHRELNGDFASQRQYALSKATKEWILIIDSDEWLTEELHDNLKELVLHSEGIDAYGFVEKPYLSSRFFKPRWVKYGAFYNNQPRVRLFRNKVNYKYQRRIHELLDGIDPSNIKPTGYYYGHKEAGYSPVILRKNVDWLQDSIIEAQIQNPKEKYYYSLFMGFKMGISLFRTNFIKNKGYLDGYLGFKLAIVMSLQKFMTYFIYAKRCMHYSQFPKQKLHS